MNSVTYLKEIPEQHIDSAGLIKGIESDEKNTEEGVLEPDAVQSGHSLGVLKGPWLNAFWVLTENRIRSKSNFRRSKSSAAWRANQDFETTLALSLRAARPLTWPVVDGAIPLSERPVFVAVTFAKSTIDAGNHSKSVLDAAEGVVYVNDAQVAASCAVAERGLSDPYLLIAFAQLPPGSSLQEIASAGSVLLSALSTLIIKRK
jgi:hypothetical protein